MKELYIKSESINSKELIRKVKIRSNNFKWTKITNEQFLPSPV